MRLNIGAGKIKIVGRRFLMRNGLALGTIVPFLDYEALREKNTALRKSHQAQIQGFNNTEVASVIVMKHRNRIRDMFSLYA